MQTQLARAVAGEAQAAFMSVAPSDVLSKFFGESEASIRDLFKKGEEHVIVECSIIVIARRSLSFSFSFLKKYIKSVSTCPSN
jgi:ATP-dependent 26S proteasome regulatory subunit